MTEAQFKANAFDEIMAMVSRKMMLDESKVRIMLMTMIITHGKDAVNDMFGWYLWAQENTKQDIEQIMVSIFHDIGGRADETMAPRTEGYMETYFNWDKKTGQ
jgi:hypothetical protein